MVCPKIVVLLYGQFHMHVDVRVMKRVKIAGAGIAGLSVGCYLQMNGYDTRIFERTKT